MTNYPESTDSNEKNNDAEQYKYWSKELKTSMKAREKWWKLSDKIVDNFLGSTSTTSEAAADNSGFRLNLFHSNIKTLGDMLYGNTPKIDVSRRYAQPNDDVGRVAATIMERLLNIDVADNGSELDAVMRSTLQDRLLCGLGCAKVRYTMESGENPVLDAEGRPILDVEGEPLVEEVMLSEDAVIEYWYWGDLAWGWCRNWAEMPWLGFRSYLEKSEVEARFGEEAAENVNYSKQTKATSEEGNNDREVDSDTDKCEVWEIWCKRTRKLHWISIGYDKQLGEKDDILGLKGFWPVPPFLIANVTTSLFTPTPDYKIAQDLYHEIDGLQSRIAKLTEAVKVVGVYNSSADGIKALLTSGDDNDLFPVENWALFGENGGMSGQVEWMPIADIVGALQELIGVRDRTIALLQQTTGMTDIMRGSLDNQYEGNAQTEAKNKFGSVRIQALQEQFACFAGNLMQIKAEVIALHFSPETIYNRANMEFSLDEELVGPAIELIKNPKKSSVRVAIRPESVAMIDYQAVQAERVGAMNAIATFLQSSAPIIDLVPESLPTLLQMLQWTLSGFKGANEIEGVLDKQIEQSLAAQKEAQGKPPEPDAAQMAAVMAQQLEDSKQKGAMAAIQAKAEATSRTRYEDMEADIATAHEQHLRKMAEINGGVQGKLAEISAALEADLLMENAQAVSNIRQTNATVEGEIQKDVVEAEISMASEREKTVNKIREIGVNAALKLEETRAKMAAAKKQEKPSE
jgi:hypothetical protein